jgi:hypothetical protein
VDALAVCRGSLFVGGEFQGAGKVPVQNIARWDGSSWHAAETRLGWGPLGSGTNGRVYALVDYDGDLYVGGSFSYAGGKPSWRIARWMNSPRIISLAIAPEQPAISVPNPYRAGQAIALPPGLSREAGCDVYSADGRRIRTLLAGVSGGRQTLSWDGRCDSGAPAGAGVYYLQTAAGEGSSAQRIVLVR